MAVWIVAAAWIAALLGVSRVTPTVTSASPVRLQSTAQSSAEEQQARAVCGGCHAFAPPQILPRAAWASGKFGEFWLDGWPRVADVESADFNRDGRNDLENRGAFPFVDRPLAQMPGVHRARAADLDNDRDLDIVACAVLASGLDLDENALPALVWLEQTAPGRFARHTIAMGFPRHVTLDVGDADGDVVTGSFSVGEAAAAWVDLRVNQGARSSTGGG